MAAKKSRRAAASKRKTSPARKGRKSSATKRTSGARSASAGTRKAVSVENFVRCIRTLHDLGLVLPFVRSAKRAKLTLTMDTAAFERVKTSVNKQRQPAPVSANIRSRASIGPATRGVRPRPGDDPFDFGSNAAPGGLGSVAPLPGHDPFDF
ncbi:hypothetical protein V1283_002931 [Bradyrhizobium sp. AZCC 2262]|uniref:hypothetical protein n=1 Tax=Bradyrhizobium sp. AZCC 2262 TaxID=3117022 RepID=UPI002FF08B65